MKSEAGDEASPDPALDVAHQRPDVELVVGHALDSDSFFKDYSVIKKEGFWNRIHARLVAP